MLEDEFDFIKDLEERGEKARKALNEKLRNGGKRIPPVVSKKNPYGINNVQRWHSETEAAKVPGIVKSQPNGDRD